MNLDPRAFDRWITIAAAVASPLLSLLVDQGVISAVVATDIGSIVASAVASYHGGRAVQRRAVAPKHAATETTATPPTP